MIERFDNFVGTVSQLYKTIQKLKTQHMKPFGLKGPHVMCLFYLFQYPDGLTAARLCELSGADKAAVSRILGELSQKGYIAYEAPESARRYRATAVLTEQGRTVTEQLDRIIERLVEEAGQGVNEDHRDIMYRSMDTIAANLDAMTKEKLSDEPIV